MKDEVAAARARQAFEQGRGLSLLERGFNLSLPAEIGFATLGGLTTSEILHGASLGTVFPLFGLLATGYLSFRLGEANNLHRLIQEGLVDQQDYEKFLDDHVRGNMLWRLMDHFKIEDSVGIQGTSSRVLQTLISAQILKASTPYQQESDATQQKPGTENTVRRVLYTQRFPDINTATATRWQEEARLTYEQLPEEIRTTEGNWTFSELEDAAGRLGFLFGQMLYYEIADSFDIRLTTTSRGRLERLLLGKPRMRRRTREYTSMLDTEVFPDIHDLAPTIQLAIQNIANSHTHDN